MKYLQADPPYYDVLRADPPWEETVPHFHLTPMQRAIAVWCRVEMPVTEDEICILVGWPEDIKNTTDPGGSIRAGGDIMRIIRSRANR